MNSMKNQLRVPVMKPDHFNNLNALDKLVL